MDHFHLTTTTSASFCTFSNTSRYWLSLSGTFPLGLPGCTTFLSIHLTFTIHDSVWLLGFNLHKTVLPSYAFDVISVRPDQDLPHGLISFISSFLQIPPSRWTPLAFSYILPTLPGSSGLAPVETCAARHHFLNKPWKNNFQDFILNPVYQLLPIIIDFYSSSPHVSPYFQ